MAEMQEYGRVVSRQIDLSREVPPATGLTKEDNYKKLNIDGRITQIIIHFPAGCNGLVEVRVGVNEHELTDWIALDDTTQPFNANFFVKRGDRLWAEIKNYDSTYSHRIGVVVTVLSPI